MEKNENQQVDSEREIKCFRKVSLLIFKEKRGEGGVLGTLSIFSNHLLWSPYETPQFVFQVQKMGKFHFPWKILPK